MNDKDRMTLAEAMGWAECGKTMGKPPNRLTFSELPDPFTDANDDYAVLEWAREKGLNDAQFWGAFYRAMNYYPSIPDKLSYQIGDYARAALKVIE